MNRKQWPKGSQEYKVERFYATGTDEYHDYHRGYLNFGLWEKENGTYEEAADNMVSRLADKLAITSESIVLDAGCGMGTQDIFLAQKYGPKKIHAIDVTWKHVDRARERARRANVGSGKVEFHHETATKLPFADGTFSALLSIEAAQHFKLRETFFREVFRVLKPGGRIAVGDFCITNKPNNFFESFMFSQAVRSWHVPKENQYSSEEYKKMLEKIGFRNVAFEFVGAKTIPGYYFEGRRPETIRQAKEVRGMLGMIGLAVADLAAYTAFKKDLCEYILVSAEKPF